MLDDLIALVNPLSLLYASVTLLWPVGLLASVSLVGALFFPGSRPVALRGIIWGLVGALVLTAGVAVLAWALGPIEDFPEPAVRRFLVEAFFAGLAAAGLLWCLVDLRPTLRRRSSNHRLERP